MQTDGLEACVGLEMKEKRTKVKHLGSEGSESLYLKKGGRGDSHPASRHVQRRFHKERFSPRHPINLKSCKHGSTTLCSVM